MKLHQLMPVEFHFLIHKVYGRKKRLEDLATTYSPEP